MYTRKDIVVRGKKFTLLNFPDSNPDDAAVSLAAEKEQLKGMPQGLFDRFCLPNAEIHQIIGTGKAVAFANSISGPSGKERLVGKACFDAKGNVSIDYDRPGRTWASEHHFLFLAKNDVG